MSMWWEGSECGGCMESVRPLAVCPEFGRAGAIIVVVEVDDSAWAEPKADSLRARWLRPGFGFGRAPAPLGV